MYLPPHYATNDGEAREIVRSGRAADFVTATESGPVVSFLPYVFDEAGGRLLAHFARGNQHWKERALGCSTAIIHRPHGYVSADWYPSTRETGGSGPTWNYVVAHARGDIVIHDDPQWAIESIRHLIDVNEADLGSSWSLDDVSEDYLRKRVRGVVAFEFVIDTIEAKVKLSQNKPQQDVDSVIAHLRQEGSAVADDMQRHYGAGQQ
ncbi:FMN-binding negative transcriptional regulator [Microbacterium paraoxydans]|uniref:FMN-binding negative transcriptional regulator n=1 Tax=Microbacterium paraoxydans TaxID=199592 RepID=UPI001CFA2E52|nr:FMN-binding negative transcriptional regulator [Microbacterium paraoxydans]